MSTLLAHSGTYVGVRTSPRDLSNQLTYPREMRATERHAFATERTHARSRCSVRRTGGQALRRCVGREERMRGDWRSTPKTIATHRPNPTNCLPLGLREV